MIAFGDLPPLADHAFFLIAGLLVVFWLYMKIAIVRGRLARRDAGEPPPDVPAWQLRLAEARWSSVVLLAIGVLLAIALALFGVTA